MTPLQLTSSINTRNDSTIGRVISATFTRPNRRGTSSRRRSTRHSSHTDSICKHTSIDGDTMPIEVRLFLKVKLQLTISTTGPVPYQNPGEAARTRAARGGRIRDFPIPRARKDLSSFASTGRSDFRIHTRQDHSQKCQYRCSARLAYRRHRS